MTTDTRAQERPPPGDDRPAPPGPARDGDGAAARSVETEVRRLLLEHSIRTGPTAEAGHLVLASVMAVILWPTVPRLELVGWLGLVAATAAWRVSVRTRLARTAALPERALPRLRRAVLFNAVAWAVGPLLIGQHLTLPEFFMMMVVYAGLGAAGTATLAADPASFLRFNVLTLGALAAAVLIDGTTRLHWSGLVLIVLFAAVMAQLFRQTHRSLVERLRSGVRARLSEADAARERAYLAALLECAPTAIATLDAEGRVRAVNPAFQTMFGFRADEAVGEPINDLIVPSDRREAARGLDALVAADERVIVEVERQRRDGSLVPVRASAGKGRAEAAGSVFVLYDDITDLKRAERRLRKAEAQYRTIVESASDLVWQSDGDGRLVFVNRASVEIYGRPPASLAGRPFSELVDPEHLEADEVAFRRVLAGDDLTDYETRHRDAHGQVRHLSFSAHPLRDETGRIVGAAGTARDVTQRVAVRQALEEARAAAERAVAVKSAFLANMSHEIRTPLNGILGMIELLLDSQLDAEQRASAELIRQSGDSLLRVINDILDFSKIEAGRVELEEVEFELPLLVESVARLLGVKAFERGLELTCDIGASVPHWIRGDPGRLRQILTNLIGNALKFTHQGEVAVSVTLASRTDDTAQVQFVVRDTGIGIPADKLQAIFEEFSQVDVTTTRQYGGTGLGLAITRRLVDLYGGELRVQSTAGRGSEFSFTIPLRVARRQPPAPPVTAGGLAGLRALVIDDNATNRRIVREMLGQAGVRVDEADGGEAGLAMLREAERAGRPFGVAILDGQMPVIDGFELAQQIRADPRVGRTKLMMLTSAGRAGDGQRCRELGISGYLSKPASRTELLETVAAVARSEPAASGPALITRHAMEESRHRLRILLAEDNPVNQRVALTLLRRRGHEVELAANGAEAVAAVRKARPDVVLMDVQMPVMDGLAATEAIRAMDGMADLPIIAVTAHALSEERERCMSAGMTGYLTKPYKPHELVAVVERWGPSAAD